jgi:hypothetical protein
MENVTVQISAKLNGSKVFYPDIEEEVDVVSQFDASLKYVTFKISSRKCVDSVPRHVSELKGKKSEKNDEHLSFFKIYFIFNFNFQKKKNPSLPPGSHIPPGGNSKQAFF